MLLYFYRLHLKDAGLYEICILNRYSNVRKSVYLGLYSESPDETWPFNHREMLEDKNEEAEMIMDMASTEIIVSDFNYLSIKESV